MGNSVTLSAKYQISVPKEVRESQGWKPGQKLAFIPSGLGYKLVPVPEPSDLVGALRGVTARDYRDRKDRY
ncbi:MAG: AbrB/MazE/SpoVT family DNA-binding domain-containing protein [Beijerinckiaceae bacterium]